MRILLAAANARKGDLGANLPDLLDRIARGDLPGPDDDLGSSGVSMGAPSGREPVSWNRDRDVDGVPDWQEDENYLDEAPIRGPANPRNRMGGVGCALPVALLLAAAVAARRAARRPA